MAKGERAVFDAVIPSIATAIRIHGESGARIMFDVDDQQLAEVLKLVAWREGLLRVTVEPIGDK